MMSIEWLGRNLYVLIPPRLRGYFSPQRRAFSVASALCLFLLSPLVPVSSSLVLAQESASLSGVVQDPKGAVVADAEVVAVRIETQTTYTAKTNGVGLYVFASLQPGHYHVVVRRPGFKEVAIKQIELHTQDRSQQNFTLELGSVSETITVDASGININTQDASVATTIDRNFADNLPMNGRTFQSLIYLSPGVTLNSGNGANGGYTLGQFSVNGQRPSSNYWMVDGVSANIGTTPWYTPTAAAAGGLGAFNVLGGTNSLVSVDALQEFRIQTSTYAPEFGRTPGGQISIVTRSGTNQFHGTAFDYFRNGDLDADDWFANATSTPKLPEKQNDFGGVLGGPIIKNKTFFFFSYEGLRLRQPQIVPTTVPDLAARADAIAAVQPYIDAFPLPNPGAADIGPGYAPFTASFSNPATVNSYSLRIDHTLTNSVNLFARYSHSPSSLSQRTGGFGPANDVFPVASITKTATVGATWTKSAETVNDVRFNYSVSGGQTEGYLDNFGGGSSSPYQSLFPSGVTYSNGASGIDCLCGTDMGIFVGHNAGNRQHQYNIVDSVSMQKGAHGLKFGIDYRHLSPRFFPREYSLSPLFTDVASMETGTSFLTETGNAAQTTFLFNNLGLYAQDTWKLSQRLTVTYGVRWDVDFRPSATDGPAPVAVTGFTYTDLSNLALAPAGVSVYGTRYGNFAPRIGMAYQLHQNAGRETVLRGGFGVFYDLSSSEVGDLNIDGYPYSVTANFFGVPFPTPPAVAAVPAIIPPNTTQGVLFGFDPHLNQPYTLQWNFSAQQSLGIAQSITVSYLGSVGRRLLAAEVVENPNANYLNAFLVGNAGSSNYNALQVQFQRRLSRGIQALGSYTWGHSIDTGSFGSYTSGAFTNINQNRGDSDFDIRNTFSGALTYEAPSLNKNALTRTITRGWSMDNIIQVHSAPAVEVFDQAFLYLNGYTPIWVRPDVVPGQPLYLYGSACAAINNGQPCPGGKALNPNAFVAPPTDPVTGYPLRQGNLGRNSLRGFGLTQWDFALHREFPIHESLKLQFRAEMFNILNHPNFAPYNTAFGVGNPYFGLSTSMFGQSANFGGAAGDGGQNGLYALGAPRSIQLALKLVF